MALNKDEEILHELYRRSFAASEPKGDWDDLLANATIDEQGRKHIPYMDYECSEEDLKSIFEGVMKEFKVPKWKRQSYYFGFMLGCSPKTKKA
jgi:hypothetical protein